MSWTHSYSNVKMRMAPCRCSAWLHLSTSRASLMRSFPSSSTPHSMRARGSNFERVANTNNITMPLYSTGTTCRGQRISPSDIDVTVLTLIADKRIRSDSWMSTLLLLHAMRCAREDGCKLGQWPPIWPLFSPSGSDPALRLADNGLDPHAHSCLGRSDVSTPCDINK